jgi:hypothetical protein
LPDGLHVAVTTQQGMKEKAPVERFETVMPPGQLRRRRESCSATPAAILHTAEPPAWGFAQ